MRVCALYSIHLQALHAVAIISHKTRTQFEHDFMHRPVGEGEISMGNRGTLEVLAIARPFRAWLAGLFAAAMLAVFSSCSAATPTASPAPLGTPTLAAPATPTAVLAATTVPPTAAPSPTAVLPVVTSTLNLTYSEPITAPVDAYALDVYAPVGARGLPVIVFLHGTGETKRGYVHFSRSAAAAGFVVYAADWPVYTLSRASQDGGRGYREVDEIVACAVRYARATAEGYGGDPSKMTIGGFSAGAAAAAMVAFLGDEPEKLWNDYAAQAGRPPQQARCTQNDGSAHVDAFIGAAGPYNLGAAARDADPRLADLVSLAPHIESRRGLRVRLVHGTADSLVPIEASVRLEEALTKAGYDAKLTRFDGPHAAPEALLIAQLRDLWKP